MSLPRRICIAGYGGRGEEQIEALADHPGVWQVVGVADRSPIAYGRLQARFYDLRIPVFPDVRRLVELDADAIVISTTAAAHAPIAGALIDAGFAGALMIEKPLAASVAAGRRIVAATDGWPGRAAVGFQRRCSPMYRAVVDAIRTRLGRVESVTYTASGPLKLSMEGSHVIDLVNWIVGQRAERVAATVEADASIDRRGSFFFDPAGVVEVTYAGGTTFRLDGTGTGEGDTGLSVVCEHGTVGVDHSELAAAIAGPGGTTTVEADAPRSRANRVWFELTLRALVGDGEGEPCTVGEGLAALEIVSAAFQSGRRGGEPLALPLDAEGERLELRVA